MSLATPSSRAKSTPKLLWHVFRYQNLVFLRNPFSAIFSLAFPVMFLLLFGMLFGRIANFINGELYGRPAGPDVPWAMVFPGGGPIARHPSQLYEAALEGALLVVIMLLLFWQTRARWRPGLLVGVFAFGIAAGRFTVEFFREPDAQLMEFAMRTGLSMGQWLTIPLMLAGLAVVVIALTRPPLGAPGASAKTDE